MGSGSVGSSSGTVSIEETLRLMIYSPCSAGDRTGEPTALTNYCVGYVLLERVILPLFSWRADRKTCGRMDHEEVGLQLRLKYAQLRAFVLCRR